MGLMSKVLDLSKPSGGSSLLKRALKLRKRIERSPLISAAPVATQPKVVVLDDVKKKPWPMFSKMAA